MKSAAVKSQKKGISKQFSFGNSQFMTSKKSAKTKDNSPTSILDPMQMKDEQYFSNFMEVGNGAASRHDDHRGYHQKNAKY